MNVDLKTLKDMSPEELEALRDEVADSKAGSFMGAVKKQYYIEQIDLELERREDE